MLLDDVVVYLSTGGVGTAGTDLFGGQMPDTPDTAVCVYETGGFAPVRAMSPSAGQAVLERASVQVVSRGAQYEYATARALAQKAWLLLEGMPARTLNSVVYKYASCRQSPFLMGVDEQGRPLVAFNADVVKAMSSTS